MPPNIQQEQTPVAFIDHFWSKDKSGMDKLFSYIQTTHQDLEMIHSIYVERSAMEHEFGQRLLTLSRDQEKSHQGENVQGVLAAYRAVSMELKQTATTHLELSDRLKHQVATECQNKLTEYKELLSKWTTALEDLYQDRKEKTIELLKIRAKYLKEHDIAKGQSTPTMEALKNQYKTMVVKVDEVAQEWNSTWREACEVLEAMEEDRVEFLKNNVWEYANLASATLLVQDECCENIRKQLEVCHVEQEIERCIALYATGSKIPTTNEYVGELMREQKKKHQAERASATENVPKPPSKPPRQQGALPPIQQQKQAPKPMQRNRDVQQQQQEKDIPENVTHNARPQEQHEPNDTGSQHQEQQQLPSHQHRHPRQEPQYQQRQEQQQQQPDPIQQKPVEASVSAVVSTTPTHDTSMDSSFKSKTDPYNNQFRGVNISNNMGSTATRGQIKRKPLNKSLMEQVSSEMAIARQQREMEQQQQQQQSTPYASVRGGKGETNNTNTYKAAKADADNGSLDILLKSFEGSSSSSNSTHASTTPEDHPNAVVSDEARYRRQPSEYKPDTGSIPSRRFTSNKNSNHHVLQQVMDTSPAASLHSSTPEPLSHPVAAVAAPKSPRPPAQQITNRDVQQQHCSNNNSNAPSSMYAQPAAAVQQQPSPNMMQQGLPEQNTGYAPQPNPAYMGHHQYQQQQYMGAPQNMAQAPMQQQRSPHMQPQRSPMIQPISSPMMQPMHSPMMQPMHSPMMQPLHSPMVQQRGTLPPPITIPTNFAATPQPSPSMSYSHLGGVSPGGILPPPTQQYTAIPPRPLQYTDGRPIQFWARAKYDYDAKDADELSFRANNLMGILDADITQQSWWVGAIYDEYRQTWSMAASIPSNFMNSSV
ncbi:uncharacterized protein ATC70_007297 [Mucor velutinosus]|uniref:SH3 domain-containing protein n=1 Tax=Mucor velutinosus TaxID=708070 RepID=A0AAN7D7P8_9FUNG|nr:hypothetical protein ATC70_007297 [Mucor velutinosus]